MIKRLIPLLMFATSCFAAKNGQLDQYVKDTTQFSLSLYSHLDKSTPNVVFSPYSVFSCLSMIYAGAREQTADEMQKALSLNFSQLKVGPLASQLATSIKPKTGEMSYELNIANGVWVDVDTFVLSDFRHTLEEDFDANIESLDFSKTEESKDIINEWVSNETQGKIPRLLESGDVTDATRMVLTNAVYFKGSWSKPFEVKNTVRSNFHPTPKTDVPVPMMSQSAILPYFDNDLVQLLALPFLGSNPKNSNLACLFFLPKEDISMKEIEDNLTASVLQSWLGGLEPTPINVKIPRFQLTMRFDLNDPLKSMGMNIPFTEKADFSGIDGMKDLFISKVVHETFFSLDEEGVTAAAATSGSLNITSVLEKPSLSFVADHPFLFMIVDLTTKTPLFMGKIQEPK